VRERRLRIGEHIAKSTCHVCHGAAGLNPTVAELYAGAIPPLGALPLRVNENEFVRKVTQGAPALMGTPPQLLRGRMPVFYYLSEDEAADVYLYLTTIGPGSAAPAEAAASAGPVAEPDDKNPPSQQARTPQPGAEHFVRSISMDSLRAKTASAEQRAIGFAVLMGVLVGGVLCVGFWLSIRELRRLSGEQQASPSAEAHGVGPGIRLSHELAR